MTPSGGAGTNPGASPATTTEVGVDADRQASTIGAALYPQE